MKLWKIKAERFKPTIMEKINIINKNLGIVTSMLNVNDPNILMKMQRVDQNQNSNICCL